MTRSASALEGRGGDDEAATLQAVLHTVALVASRVHPGAEVSGRLKTLHSRAQKRRSRGGARPKDDIGIRVIVANVAHCYEVIRQIHGHFEFLRAEYDDYIAQPKDNGYRSVHTTILTSCGHPVELQVRTRAMHIVAEEGSASHRLYKQTAREGSGDWGG